MSSTEPTPKRNLVQYLGLVARGFCMGAADIVPGVSGGTMAFILGIYEELLQSINALDMTMARQLVRLKIRQALSRLPWQFLLSLTAGIVLAILLLAQLLESQLTQHPSQVWAFFFGLVLASVLTVSQSVARWTAPTIASSIFATLGGYLVVGATPVQTPETPWYLFLSGALAICAMILPGISGAFILVLLGKYQFVLSAVNQRDLLPLALIMCGALLGLLTFARLLRWLFQSYHDITVATLTGIMLGSLRKLWPWKENLISVVDDPGLTTPLRQVNVIPETFTSDVGLSIAMSLIGLVVVLAITSLGNQTKRRGQDQS